VLQIHLSFCSVTDAGLLALLCLSCLRNVTMFHLSGVSLNVLVTALLMSTGLTKVKVEASFKPMIPQVLIELIESRGCSLHWSNKPFQAELESRELWEEQSHGWLAK
jgi:F-box and leucine-rich repeat protein 2/20